MSYPTEHEKKLITRFRSRVFDILKPGEDRSDHFIIRWIRAANGNLEKAELNIRKSFEWRREFDADTMLSRSWDPLVIREFPFYVRAKDNMGHPILEIPIGLWDVAKIVETDKELELFKFITQVLELLMQTIRESNEGRQPWEFQNTQFTAIIDWEGYTYAHFTNWKAMQCVIKLISIFETNYPDTLYKGFFVNCPAMFSRFYAMMKPLISERTISRIKIYGTRKETWEGKLKALIDLDQLPENYGGILSRKY